MNTVETNKQQPTQIPCPVELSLVETVSSVLEFDKCFGENIIWKGRMVYCDLNRGVRIGLIEG